MRLSGKNFDINRFLTDCPWRVHRIRRRGDLIKPNRPDRGVEGASSCNILVSKKGMDDFEGQMADAIGFITRYGEMMHSLVSQAKLDYLSLDFGVTVSHSFYHSFEFAHELISLAEPFKLRLMLTLYPEEASEA